MKISKPVYTMSMTEKELWEAIEFYMLHKHNQDVSILHLKHKENSWTEGGGGMPEFDYTEPDGIEFKCQDN